jgi:alkylated DNA repair dioxygenase AlkB
MSIFKTRCHAQLSLLDDRTMEPSRRIALDETSWVEHITRWIDDDTLLMQTLLDEAPWEQRTRWMYMKNVLEPRLTAEFHVLREAPVPRVRELGEALSVQYSVSYDSVWMNLYRDQNDSTAWHGDRPCLRDNCIVPVLSLGATRRFLIRPKHGGRTRTFIARSGDLIVMGGRCQKDWVHCVPKESAHAGARISINFASKLQAVADAPSEDPC